MWRSRMNNLRAAIEQWLVSHEQATDQAIRGEQGAQAPSQAHQNKEELAVLVAATRASALMAGDSERRCAMETATITELRRKLHDTQYCKLCPGGSALSLQSRWHVLGVCLHPDLRDARMKAAKEIREVARRTFLSITDREGRLPLGAALRHEQGRPVGLAGLGTWSARSLGMARVAVVGAVGAEAHG